MRMLVFDIRGKMAHFRRFYSNVTSLSYYFPPRNTIIGMLASILGYDRDSYYDILSRERIGLGVGINNKMRKIILPTNYLDTDNIGEPRLRGEGRKPTSVEYVIPYDIATNELSYRIYCGVFDESFAYHELLKRIENNTYVYPLSLGSVNCLAIAKLVYDGEFEIVSNKNELAIETVIAQEYVKRINYVEDRRIMLEERLPPDLDMGRRIKGNSRNFIFEEGGKEITIEPTEKAIESKSIFSVSLDRMIYGAFL